MSSITQAALPKRNESAVLAIQPHQADQPSDGMDSLKTSTSATSGNTGGPGGLWRTLLIWGAVVLIILILAAVAPICHYSRLRPFNFLGVEAAPQMVQRLVGELEDFFLIIFFFHFFNPDRPPRGSLERERFIEELEKRGDLPVIIIATVSGLITFLLLFVVILGTVCFFYKKKRKEKQLKGLQKAPSEGTYRAQSFTLVKEDLL